MWTWRDREAVQDTLEELTGNRVNYGVNKVGGVRRDFAPARVGRALSRLEGLDRAFVEYARIAEDNPVLKDRFRGVARLSRAEALRLGTVGPTARASGVPYDMRVDDPYAAYPAMRFEVVTESGGDVLARVKVRIREMRESAAIVGQALEGLPPGPVAVRAPRQAPPCEVISRYEAPRGELVYTIVTDGSERPARVDIRTPTLANWTSVAASLPGCHLSDLPVVVAAIDPCLSCTSRVSVVDTRRGKSTSLSWDDLRAMGIARQRRRRRSDKGAAK
jgi:NADH-quinone oxidoreductase subunit D